MGSISDIFLAPVQLLKNLRQSVATLQICGEWGSGNDDATLEMSTDSVWMQGRAPQKRLTALQVRAVSQYYHAHALKLVFIAPCGFVSPGALW